MTDDKTENNAIRKIAFCCTVLLLFYYYRYRERYFVNEIS